MNTHFKYEFFPPSLSFLYILFPNSVETFNETQKKQTLAYTETVLKQFFQEFFVKYTEFFVEENKEPVETIPRCALKNGYLHSGLHFKIPGFEILDPETENAFIAYTIRGFDGKMFRTVHKRFDQFKELHKVIGHRVKPVELPPQSSGALGMKPKKVTAEFAAKRQVELAKYLADCEAHNIGNQIPELKKFIIGDTIDASVNAAATAAFEKVTRLAPLSYDDVGEALTKYITETCSLGKDIIESGNAEKALAYYKNIITLIDPTVEFNIAKRFKTITDSKAELTREDDEIMAQIFKDVTAIVTPKTDELFEKKTRTVDVIGREFGARLENACSSCRASALRAKAIIRGLFGARYPDSTLIPGIAFGIKSTFDDYVKSIENAFTGLETFGNGEKTPERIANFFAILPAFFKAFFGSINVEKLISVLWLVAALRGRTSTGHVSEDDFKAAKDEIASEIAEAYVDSLETIEEAKEQLFKDLNTLQGRKDVNTVPLAQRFFRFMKEMAGVRRNALRVFCGYYFAHGLQSLSGKELDAAVFSALKYARRYLKKSERSAFTRLFTDLLSIAVFEQFRAKITEDVKENLKAVNVPGKHEVGLNPVSVAQLVIPANFSKSCASVVADSFNRVFALPKTKDKVTFFVLDDKRQDKGDEEDGCVCSCEDPDCDCTKSKDRVIFSSRSPKKHGKPLSHADLVKLAKENATGSKHEEQRPEESRHKAKKDTTKTRPQSEQVKDEHSGKKDELKHSSLEESSTTNSNSSANSAAGSSTGSGSKGDSTSTSSN